MFEIEAKVPLTKADFEKLKKEIPKIAKLKKRVKSADRYYGDLKKSYFFRIREENKKPFIYIKSKKREQGIETNQEIELPIKSSSAFDKFLREINIPLSASKEKKGVYYQYKKMQIELVEIKGLGPFLEIEHLVKSKSEIPKAKKALRELFKKLGFNPSDYESKYYLELLEEKRKAK